MKTAPVGSTCRETPLPPAHDELSLSPRSSISFEVSSGCLSENDPDTSALPLTGRMRSVSAPLSPILPLDREISIISPPLSPASAPAPGISQLPGDLSTPLRDRLASFRASSPLTYQFPFLPGRLFNSAP